jgi:hypothetical protein
VPALKAAIEDLKANRLQAGWEKLEHFGVIKEVVDDVELHQRLGTGQTIRSKSSGIEHENDDEDD